MKLKFEMHIPPDAVRIKMCDTCQFSKQQAYSNDRGDVVSIQTLCTVVHKLVADQQPSCEVYEPIHWETIRVNDYRKL